MCLDQLRAIGDGDHTGNIQKAKILARFKAA
jgi:hypothetical protein